MHVLSAASFARARGHRTRQGLPVPWQLAHHAAGCISRRPSPLLSEERFIRDGGPVMTVAVTSFDNPEVMQVPQASGQTLFFCSGVAWSTTPATVTFGSGTI